MSWLRFFAEMVVTYIPSHFQWTWDDLGHSPFSKFLQYHHHPSKKPPRNLEVSARIPLVICLWTASEVTQMLTFDAWTSDWRWFPQYPPILCCMSRVCLARCFKSIFYILYAKHVFFFKKNGAFRCFASCFHSTSQPWAKAELQASSVEVMQQVVLTRGVPRKLMGIFGMEGEDVAPRPGFSKILKSVTPKRPCLTQSFNIYIQTHKHIYIIYIYNYIYMYIYIIYISQYIDLS